MKHADFQVKVTEDSRPTAAFTVAGKITNNVKWQCTNKRWNIIIYKVPESPSTSAEERGIDDKRFCVQFLTRLNIGLTDEDVNKVVRLGKKGQAPEPRPLLLQFDSRMAKNHAMESARLLVRQFDSDGNELRRVQLPDDESLMPLGRVTTGNVSYSLHGSGNDGRRLQFVCEFLRY